jgi:hypothetical protein
MKKLIKDNKVAVLYSPGFGAGWTTWNTAIDPKITEHLLFGEEFVNLVLAGKLQELKDLAEELYPDLYLGGAYDLKVMWLDHVTPFRIREYDGSESIEIFNSDNYFVA